MTYDDTSSVLLVKLQDDHPVKEINLHGFPFGFLDLGRLCCQLLGWSPVSGVGRPPVLLEGHAELGMVAASSLSPPALGFSGRPFWQGWSASKALLAGVNSLIRARSPRASSWVLGSPASGRDDRPPVCGLVARQKVPQLEPYAIRRLLSYKVFTIRRFRNRPPPQDPLWHSRSVNPSLKKRWDTWDRGL